MSLPCHCHDSGKLDPQAHPGHGADCQPTTPTTTTTTPTPISRQRDRCTKNMTWHFCPSTATHHALANAPTQAHCGARPQTEALLRLPWRGSTGDPPWRSWRRRWRALSRPGSRRLRGPIHARQRHQDRLAHLSGSNQMKQPTDRPTDRLNEFAMLLSRHYCT